MEGYNLTFWPKLSKIFVEFFVLKIGLLLSWSTLGKNPRLLFGQKLPKIVEEFLGQKKLPFIVPVNFGQKCKAIALLLAKYCPNIL